MYVSVHLVCGHGMNGVPLRHKGNMKGAVQGQVRGKILYTTLKTETIDTARLHFPVEEPDPEPDHSLFVSDRLSLTSPTDYDLPGADAAVAGAAKPKPAPQFPTPEIDTVRHANQKYLRSLQLHESSSSSLGSIESVPLVVVPTVSGGAWPSTSPSATRWWRTSWTRPTGWTSWR